MGHNKPSFLWVNQNLIRNKSMLIYGFMKMIGHENYKEELTGSLHGINSFTPRNMKREEEARDTDKKWGPSN